MPNKPATAVVTTVLAFAAIYLLWGSTFLGIRIAVETVPPLFAAGLRFLIAGAALYAWARLRGGAKPTLPEWRSIVLLAAILFLVAYGGTFWAEKTVPSGITSVLAATIPIWTALLEIFVFRKVAFRWSVAASVLLGVGGVFVLAFDSSAGLTLWPTLALVVAQVCWALGSVLSKTLPKPSSMLINSGAQMLVGGILLVSAAAVFGELHPLPHLSQRAFLAILYLSVAGSIVAFTAYVWLLARMSATVVTSYAYVNPVVALLLGHWLGNEVLGLRTLLGAALVLGSVLVALRGART